MQCDVIYYIEDIGLQGPRSTKRFSGCCARDARPAIRNPPTRQAPRAQFAIRHHHHHHHGLLPLTTAGRGTRDEDATTDHGHRPMQMMADAPPLLTPPPARHPAVPLVLSSFARAVSRTPPRPPPPPPRARARYALSA
jgi:hypothetical protein